MRVAVTGATGFIGHHVLAELCRRGHKATACVRDASRLPVEFLQMGVEIRHVDIGAGDEPDWPDLGSPDVLIHLAWDGLPNYHSLHHFESELPKQYAFLARLVRTGLPALAVTGTCFEYGMQSGALSEEAPCLPNNCYGFAKNTLHRQLRFLSARHSFNLVWARLFYLYGDGQAPSSLLSQLRRAVTEGKQVFDMSGGEQLRDYLPVASVANYLSTLATLGQDVGPVNICSGKPISVRRLVESWIGEHGWKIELNLGHYPYPDYEPLAFWGNADKLSTIISSAEPASSRERP
jgi:nucleoside-diphosphate-sugar epimerase